MASKTVARFWIASRTVVGGECGGKKKGGVVYMRTG